MGKNNRRRNNKKKNAGASTAPSTSVQAVATSTPVVEAQPDNQLVEDDVNNSTTPEVSSGTKGAIVDEQVTEKECGSEVSSTKSSENVISVGEIETTIHDHTRSVVIEDNLDQESKVEVVLEDEDETAKVVSVDTNCNDVEVDNSNDNECSVVESKTPCQSEYTQPECTQPECTQPHEVCDDDDDDDDASLSDLVNQDQTAGEDEDYVAVSTSNYDGQDKENDSDSPNSNSSYVMVTEEEEEVKGEDKQHQWVDPLSLPPTSPAVHQDNENDDEDQSSEDAGSDGDEFNIKGSDQEQDDDVRRQEEYDFQAQLRDANYVEEDELSDDENDMPSPQMNSGEGYYADDFEDEDGMVEDEGHIIQQHLQEMQEQQNIDDSDNDDDVDVEEGRQFLSLEPRVAIAVALKVVNILRKNKVLDGRSSGQVKDKIFGGDQEVLRAVEEFTTTQSVERLVSVIHNLSL